MSFIGIFNAFVGLFAYDKQCDFFSNMDYEQTYYIYNPQYPYSYGRGQSCRWVARSPPDTRIELTCNDINIPYSVGCFGENLQVSLSGNVELDDGHRYCGQGTLNLKSDSNRISLALNSPWNGYGGRFSCSIKAVRITPEPTCDCGWRQTRRIVGGTETGVNEFPNMAVLINFNLRAAYCGASIISPRYVLCAAHCMTANNNASNIGVLVGDHDLKTGTDTNSAALYRVENIIIHEKFVPGDVRMHYDIALLKTQTEIKFSIDVGPICLPFRYTTNTFENAVITIAGWGTIEFAGPSSDVLLSANLKGVSNAYCAGEHPAGDIQSSQLCLYEKGKDGCQSDSGGPCMFFNTNQRRLYLVGVISYGLGCGTEKPNVNTRVTSYLDWIVENTPDAQYCRL